MRTKLYAECLLKWLWRLFIHIFQSHVNFLKFVKRQLILLEGQNEFLSVIITFIVKFW